MSAAYPINGITGLLAEPDLFDAIEELSPAERKRAMVLARIWESPTCRLATGWRGGAPFLVAVGQP